MSKEITKKKVNSRNKGATYERKIAKMLTDWTGIEIRRTPMSGGWNKTGDLTPKDPSEMEKFPLSFELKNRQEFSIEMLFHIRNSEDMPKILKKYWDQCSGEAKESEKVPLLILTRNNADNFIMFDTGIFDNIILPHIQQEAFLYPDYTYLKSMDITVMLLSDFLRIPYSLLKDLKC